MPVKLIDIRVFAVDLDGTALTSAGRLSTRTVEAIDRVTGHGLRIWFVSARPLWSVRALTAAIQKRDVAIGAAGAVVEDARGTVLYRRPLPAPGVHAVLERVEEEQGAAMSYRGEQVSATGSHPALEAELLLTAKHAPVPENGADADKILVFTLEDSALERRIRQLPSVQVSRSGASLLEVTAAGTDKGSALAHAAAVNGFHTRELAAIGDSATDLPMLRRVGLPLAVGNAIPTVLAMSMLDLPSNDDEGLGHVLEQWQPPHVNPTTPRTQGTAR